MKSIMARLILVALSSTLLGLSASAAEKAAPAFKKQATGAEDTRKPRKKNVQICAECGMPEPECECPHAKVTKKKSK